MNAATSRIAIVTGAGSGIGRAVSVALAKDGFRVVLAGRRFNALQETRQLIEEESGAESSVDDRMPQCLPISTDVGSQDSVRNLFAEAQSHFGRLDLLFNNAGVNIPATSIEDVRLEDWQRVVDTNLTGMFLCTREAIRLMKSQDPRGGRIINNGSISSHVPRPGSIAYTATKHAVTGLTKSTALDCRQYNIACGQIDIGNAETSMAARMRVGVPQADGRIAVEPMMATEDVAAAVLYMANLPLGANVPFMTVMATNMPYIGRG